MITKSSTKPRSSFSRDGVILAQRRRDAEQTPAKLAPPLREVRRWGRGGIHFAPTPALPLRERVFLQRFLSVSLRLCAILLVVSNAKADWPFARGNTDSTGATKITLPDEPALLWTYEPEGAAFEATPVVAGGVVYLGDADGTMHAVRLKDGSQVWTTAFDETFLLSPAAVWGQSVFVPDADGTIHVLAVPDGAERWTFDAGAEVYGGSTVFTEKTREGILLVPTEAGKLFALDAKTGAERWAFEIEAPLRCSPTVVNGHALLAGCDGKLHTIDVLTGAETGTCEIGGPTGNTAAVSDGVAYFGMEGGEFYAIEVADPAKPTIKWTRRDPKRGQGIRTAAAVTGEAVFYANQAKTISALDLETGEPLWQKRTRSGVEASPLALGNGRVLALTRRGRVLLLDAKTGDEAWSYDAGGEFIASPAASDGRVLIANTDGTLRCFGVSVKTGDARR